jgi:hypothetical protein
LFYGLIRNLQTNKIYLPNNKYNEVKSSLKKSILTLKNSLSNIKDKIDKYNPNIKKVYRIKNQLPDCKNVVENNVNDILFLHNEINILHVKCLNSIENKKPHLHNIMANLFETYKPCLTYTLYDIIDTVQDKIQLNHYNKIYDKLIILGNVDVEKYKDIFIKINENFGINIPNSRYIIQHTKRYKEINILLNKISYSCQDYIIGRTDKTKKTLIVDSKIYFKETMKPCAFILLSFLGRIPVCSCRVVVRVCVGW